MPATKEIFAKYLNEVFIETGTYHGDGVNAALSAGFKTVISIELSEKLFQENLKRFKGNKRVTILHGDSHILLDAVLSLISVPVTFWLDAHPSDLDTAQGRYPSPLIQEIQAIGRHHIKTHTVLIDDMRYWIDGLSPFNEKMLRDGLLAINPDYVFSYEDGIVMSDILVAR